ncbi:MAG: GAF domain-containing protein [Chloroflexi bacterium]|nr:GAF domain-containing protein [Chloroflexota bacterium]MBP7044887.1 GAF domain-containing protein [Chloroflexota bacterium]
MAKELTYDQFKTLVETQGQELLNFLAYAAAGDLNREVTIPEGIDVLTDLAIGLSYLIDDLRALVERERQAQIILEQRVAERTEELQYALAEVQTVQRRYVEREWTTYAAEEIIGDQALPLAITPIMETAVLQQQTTYADGESALAIPIRYADEVIGLLGFANEETNVNWDENDFAAVEAIVEQVGFALENQRLFDQTQAALSESSSLYEASAEMNAAQTYDDILAVVRKFTIAGTAQSVSFSIFDRPWTASQTPDWIELLAIYTQRENQEVIRRYPLSDFPSADTILKPNKPTIIEDFNHPTIPIHEAIINLYTKQFGARSAIFVPLVVGSQWIGYINALYREPSRFLESDIRRLTALASQSAISIQNVISVAETKARADELGVLNEMSRALATMLEPREIIESIHGYVNQLLDADNFFIALYDPQANELNYPVALEDGKPVQISTRPFGNGLTEHIIQKGQAVLIEKDLESYIKEQGLTLLGDPAHSWLGTPMISGRQIIGVIGVLHPDSYRYNENHLNLLSAVASQATIALQNARLFQQTQTRAQREQLLREITARVRSSADMDTIMKTAVKEIGQALGRRTFIYLGSDSEQTTPSPAENKKGARDE